MSDLLKEKQDYLKLLKQKEEFLKYNFITTMFPDDGPLRRELYPKHLEFFKAGADKFLRAMVSANQTGKTTAACIEDSYHLTGEYPKWWQGIKYDRPITLIIAGDRGEVIRDSIQQKLLGSDPTDPGTGFIPKHCINDLKSMPGIPGGIGQYFIDHYTNGVKDGISKAIIKTYESGRNAFEAMVADIIHLDEECPKDIFSECITRLASKAKPRVYLTFTPDSGLTETVKDLLSDKDRDIKHVTRVTWEDVPHLSEETKRVLLASYSIHERECRTKGIPYLGRGKIYPISEDDFVISPLEQMPRWWPRVFAMDVGYKHPTAIVWGAWDRTNDILYVYADYKTVERSPSEHAGAILSKEGGHWIPGVIDTSSSQVHNADVPSLYRIYKTFGINLYFVKKGPDSIEQGILEVFHRLTSGRLKISKLCQSLIEEIRLYRRDDRGRPVDEDDDLMDALRYICTTGLQVAMTEPDDRNYTSRDYQGVSEITGY